VHRDELRLGNNQRLTAGGGMERARRRQVSCCWSLGGGAGTVTWAWRLGAAASRCFLEGECKGRSLGESSHDGFLEAAMAGSRKRQLGK
jgi:hypothetical protein